MSEHCLTRQEYVGKVFVRRHRLEICRAVLKFEVEPPESFNATQLHKDIAERIESPHPTVSMIFGELHQFELFDWVERLSPKQTKLVDFIRLDHAMWPVMQAAITAMDTLYPPPATAEAIG